jgi:osmotically inducible protein OsmC
MKEIQSSAHVHWSGDLANGRGQTTTESKALDGALYSVASRFEHGEGTNPEELIAAAHASCFTMMLAKLIADQKVSLEELSTDATVVMRQQDRQAKITQIHLKTRGKAIGMNAESFRKTAEQAKDTCPISTLLKPGLQQLTLETQFD